MQRLWLTGAVAVSSWFIVCGSLTICGQTPIEAGARIKAASQRDSLENADAKPWHLKMDATLFDDEGKNPVAGTIEVWRSGADRRTVYEFGGKRYTRLDHANTSYTPVEHVDLPYRARQILNAALRMGPSDASVDQSVPEMRKQSFGKVSLDCVMLTGSTLYPLPQYPPKPHASAVPLGLFPTYCFTPSGEHIALHYGLGGEFIQYMKFGRFEEHGVPLQMEIAGTGVVLASASVSLLQTFEPKPDEFTPTTDLKEGGAYARLASGIISGRKIGGPVPIYPKSAKQDHVSGTVVMHALIGTDGHIHSLEPIQSPDLALTVSAIQAVRRWTYQPYLLNGEPTEVDTTITVNFNLYGS